MLYIQHSILVLHSLPSDFSRDSTVLHLVDMSHEDFVAFELCFSTRRVVSYDTITIERLGQEKLADSNIDRDQDLSEFSALQVNLTICRDRAEVGESECRLHYLLGVEHGSTQPVKDGY